MLATTAAAIPVEVNVRGSELVERTSSVDAVFARPGWVERDDNVDETFPSAIRWGIKREETVDEAFPFHWGLKRNEDD
ncbi:hypothetical protein QCA50_000924 [Cerrena zonata]|uniref:Uncharacterized protein n=1 Tax=Cerrena zonata TaxID=2478898 RepID=A0AAW0H0J5_9APHY